MIFLAKGHCYLGRRRIDKDGNVTEESPARFELDTDGGSVAVGVMDLDTMQKRLAKSRPKGILSGSVRYLWLDGNWHEMLHLLVGGTDFGIPEDQV